MIHIFVFDIRKFDLDAIMVTSIGFDITAVPPNFQLSLAATQLSWHFSKSRGELSDFIGHCRAHFLL